MKLAASLDVNGNTLKDGNKVFTLPSATGTLATIADIPQGSFIFKGTATSLSQDETTLTVDGVDIVASTTNIGHVYQLDEEEVVSNGNIWVNLGPDLSNYQKKSDISLVTTDKTVTGAINELNGKIQRANILVMNFYTDIEWAQWHSIMGAIRINGYIASNIATANITIGNGSTQDFISLMTNQGYVDIPADNSVVFDVTKTATGNASISLTYVTV